MSKGQTLQDPFLNSLRKDRIPVSIFLVNGIKLQGQIESFDQYVVLLKNTVSQMVYKHAISTVVPARNPRSSTASSSSSSAQSSGSASGYQGGGFDRGNQAGGMSSGYEERGFPANRSGFNRSGFGQDRGFERGGFGQDSTRSGFGASSDRTGFGQDRGFENPGENTGLNDTPKEDFNDSDNH